MCKVMSLIIDLVVDASENEFPRGLHGLKKFNLNTGLST